MENAAELYNKVNMTNLLSLVDMFIGVCLFLKGDIEEALKKCEKAIEEGQAQNNAIGAPYIYKSEILFELSEVTHPITT